MLGGRYLLNAFQGCFLCRLERRLERQCGLLPRGRSVELGLLRNVFKLNLEGLVCLPDLQLCLLSLRSERVLRLLPK